MAGRTVRRGAVLGVAVLWWWAALRLALVPDAGALEGVVAAGGWGLSLLPVHCMPKSRATGAVARGRWRRAWRAGSAPTVPTTGSAAASPPTGSAAAAPPTGSASPGSGTASFTTASRRPRSDGGSGPS
ncbi:hypothetical protein GCM10027074_76280 [Streptomyces deserti]